MSRVIWLAVILLFPGVAAAAPDAAAPPATPPPAITAPATTAPATTAAPTAAAPYTAPATSAPASPPAAKPPAAAAAPAMPERIHSGDATGVLGRDVKDPKGDDIGHIVNVLVDPAGLPRAAVIEVGGFLGVGSRRIAVAWRALDFPPSTSGAATLDMSMDQIKATPEYRDEPGGKPITVAAPPPAAPPAAQSH